MVQQSVSRAVSRVEGLKQWLTALGFPPTDLQPVPGGDINQSFRADTERGPIFVKTHHLPPEPMPGGPTFFEAEARGLALLASGGLPTPRILAVDERGLVLEWLAPGPRTSNAERQAGRELAALHQVAGERFGLDHDNFMGALPQANGRVEPDTFARFFLERRLLPLVARAGLPSRTTNRIESLRLDELVARTTTPRLVHGDLWSGNLHYTEAGARFIDPAVAYGHPEQDLAMTRLFGGFGPAFYEGYREVDARPFDEGLAERLDVLTLYPLLVHVVLFGGGYLRQVESLLDRFD